MKANRFRFRAWRESDRHMLLNQMVGVTSKDKMAVYSADNGVNANYDILMQSTGLTDKRGREIFEGDILRLGNVVPFRCFAVKWGNIENHEYECVDGTGWMFSPDILVECEVVGNIYQNPELLKG